MCGTWRSCWRNGSRQTSPSYQFVRDPEHKSVFREFHHVAANCFAAVERIETESAEKPLIPIFNELVQEHS